jgi:hypothetical protein
LGDAVAVVEAEGGPFLAGETWCEEPCPVVTALLEELRGECGDSRVQGLLVIDSEEGIVFLAEGDTVFGQILGEVGVAVEVGGDGEGEVAGDAERHRSHDTVEDIEVVMQESFAAGGDAAVVRVVAAAGVGDERAASLQALEDASDTWLAVEPAVVGLDEVLLALALGCVEERDVLLSAEAFQPRPVGLGSLLEDHRFDTRDPGNFVEEIDQVLRTLEALEVAVEDDAVERGVGELDEAAEKLRQSVHGLASSE